MDQKINAFNKYQSLDILKKALSETNTLRIIHPDAIWIASFEWYNPLGTTQAEIIRSQFSLKIPNDLIEFWAEISNGCLLYYDLKYGQWGYKIYNALELQNKQLRWMNLFSDQWNSKLLAIGEIIDEDHPIIVREETDRTQTEEYILVEGNPLDPIEYWPIMASTIQEWIDRLITTQGAKYWDWK